MAVPTFRTARPSHGKLILLWDSIERIIKDSEDEESPQPEEHGNRIRCQYNQLLNNLTSVPDIVAQMYERHMLSDKEREHLQQFHSTPIRASEELLNIIVRKSPAVYQCFLETLHKTKQHHVYQMLSSDQKIEITDGQPIFEHSRLIRQNYHWLTESLDPDYGLLSLLFQREVLSSRDYEQIRSFQDRFKKNESLLSIISRKTPDDFRKFQNALNETLQSDIVNRIMFGHASENARSTRAATDEKPQRPVVKPKSWKQTIPASPCLPLLKPKTCQPEPNQLPLHVDKKLSVIKKNNAQQKPCQTKTLKNLKKRFSELENIILRRDISAKMIVIREKTRTENIWEICARNIFRELQLVQRQMIAEGKIASDKYDELEQNILHEKSKVQILEEKIRKKQTRIEMQNLELHEQIDDLERNLSSTAQANAKLLETLRMNEMEIMSLKYLIQQTEKETKENEIRLSKQLMEALDKLGLADAKLQMLQNSERDLENSMEIINQLKDQLVVEQEQVFKLEMQLKGERVMESQRNPVEQSERNFNDTVAKVQEQTAMPSEMNVIALKLNPNEIELMSSPHSGDVRSEETLQSIYSSEADLVRMIKTKAADEKNKPIHGMTIIDEELFVVSGKSSEVEVFHVEKLKFRHRWKIRELLDPLDIASCKRKKRLYILDSKDTDQSLSMLVLNSNGKLLAKVRTGFDYGRLSVTKESNVILAAFWKGKLNVYSSDVQLLHVYEVKLPQSIAHPRHAIRLANYDFLVSHGFYDDEVHGVCVVGSNGEVKKSYGGKGGSGIGQMNVPNYMAVDREGFIYVADRRNNQVLLLNPDLRFERVLISKTTTSLRCTCTTRILLDESNNRLLVVDNEFDSENNRCFNGQISIFRMK